MGEVHWAFDTRRGRVVALKIDDGAYRARPPVMAAALRRLGVDTEEGIDGPALNATGVAVLLGGGRPVGELRVVHPMLVT